MRRVLVLDGGGCKGVAQAVVLKAIEDGLRQRIAKTFDLVVGSSVGAILGSIVATGRVPAAQCLDMMLRTIPELFRRRPWPLLPKYSREPFYDAWTRIGLHDFGMYECRTRFMCTAVSYIDRMTHFFKSWHQEEADRPLYAVQVRSWAAPFYFGKVIDRDGVWGDGGCGLYNCPLPYAMTQTARLGWLGRGPLHVLSIGTGHSAHWRSRSDAERKGNASQVLAYLSPGDGGMARYEATHQAVQNAQALVGHVPQYTFQRLDVQIPRPFDKLDRADALEQYSDLGAIMAQEINWSALRGG